MSHDGAAWRWPRHAATVVSGLVAVALLATSGLLLVAAVHVTTPDHPGRVVSVLFLVPQVQEEAAAEMVADVQAQEGAPLPDDEREELRQAVEQALGSEHLHARLRTWEADAGFGEDELVGLLVEAVEEQAAQSGPATAARLRAAAEQAEQDAAAAGPDGGTGDLATTLTTLRTVALWGAFFTGLPGLGAAAVAVAVRRGATAAVLATGALLLVAGAAGRLLGAETGWTIALSALLPVALWWGVRSLRGSSDLAPAQATVAGSRSSRHAAPRRSAS